MAASYTGGRVALTTHLSVDLSVSVNRVRLPAGHQGCGAGQVDKEPPPRLPLDLAYPFM